MLYFATKYAIESIDQPDFPLIVANSNNAINIFEQLSHIVLDTNYFKGGWACSKKYGDKYGCKYIGPFKKDIEDMFLLRQNDMLKRLGPG